MKLKFFSLSVAQLALFSKFKTERDLALHGPLMLDQEVPVHYHQESALYVVNGLADFTDGVTIFHRLGNGADINAVFVPAGQKHGWISREAGTQIEHVFGTKAVELVTA